MRKVKIQPSLRLLPHKMHSNITRWERLPQLGSQRGALNSFRLQMDYSNLTLLNTRVSAFGNSTWAQCYNGLAQQCRLLSKTRYCTGHACLLVRGWQNKPGLDSYHSAHSWKKLRFYDNVCHILLKKKRDTTIEKRWEAETASTHAYLLFFISVLTKLKKIPVRYSSRHAKGCDCKLFSPSI